MADAQNSSLSEQYSLEKVEKPATVTEPLKENTAHEEVVLEQIEEAPTAFAEASKESTPPNVEDSEVKSTTENSNETAPAASEESSETTEGDNSGDQEVVLETSEIKIETAPADFRFPTTNQTRHCFTRYVEYHRCVAAKGEEAQECDKFSKYYRALCPGEWVDRWNEQRENGTFPGPL